MLTIEKHLKYKYKHVKCCVDHCFGFRKLFCLLTSIQFSIAFRCYVDGSFLRARSLIIGTPFVLRI